MISNIKNRYSFFYIELLSLFFIKTITYLLIHISVIDSYGLGLFLTCLSILGLLVVALILYIFELIFPEFRIPQKIVRHLLYKIWFYTLLPFSIILILLASIPIITLLISFYHHLNGNN